MLQVRNLTLTNSAMTNKGSELSLEHECFATCHPGLEEIVAQELSSPEIRARDVRPGKAGVHFRGDNGVVYRSNLWLRAAIRVLMLLSETQLNPHRPAGETLYEAFRDSVEWHRFLPPGESFTIDGRIHSNSTFSTTELLLKRGRDAICDAVRDHRNQRPAPPPKGRVPHLPLFATVFQDCLRVYRDCSGISLHRRGYRQIMHAASLNEAAAAGILYMSGWPSILNEVESRAKGEAVLVDPMCGSGTFLIEAALMATNTAPGLFRRWWPCTHWQDASPEEWVETVENARQMQKIGSSAPSIHIWGNDCHEGALSLAIKDIKSAGMQRYIRLHHGKCREWNLPKVPPLVVCNPPWGRRLSDNNKLPNVDESHETDVVEAWEGLGVFLKRETSGADTFVLSGSTGPTKHLRLRADRKIPLTIGGVDCRLLKYHIL